MVGLDELHHRRKPPSCRPVPIPVCDKFTLCHRRDRDQLSRRLLAAPLSSRDGVDSSAACQNGPRVIGARTNLGGEVARVKLFATTF
jgi:hypothetical protein